MLERLYAAKAKCLEEDQRREPLEALLPRAERSRGDRRSFRDALAGAHGPAIIAEIKRASPSKGLIARNFDAAEVAAGYERAGADAVSVLTESDHFLGDLSYLAVARQHCTRPLLRKDFLTTAYQVAQSAAYGADAILLIVAGLDDAALVGLLAEARRYDLDVLVEVHDEVELARAVAAGAAIIGINNRDLRTFETDLGVTEELLPAVPPGVIVISESGVHDASASARLHRLGAHGFLIGEALMQAEDPWAFVAEIKQGVPAP